MRRRRRPDCVRRDECVGVSMMLPQAHGLKTANGPGMPGIEFCKSKARGLSTERCGRTTRAASNSRALQTAGGTGGRPYEAQTRLKITRLTTTRRNPTPYRSQDACPTCGGWQQAVEHAKHDAVTRRWERADRSHQRTQTRNRWTSTWFKASPRLHPKLCKPAALFEQFRNYHLIFSESCVFPTRNSNGCG